MRTIHVVAAISDEASGPSYSVRRLCESLAGVGADVRLASLDWGPISQPPEFLRRFPLGSGPRRLGISPQMHRWLREESSSGQVQVLHNHGLWMMPNVYAGQVCKNGKCRLMVSPRGTLSRWAFGRNPVQKQMFWRLFQRRAIANAAAFHATADSELNDIRRLGFSQPVCVLPNGVDIPSLEKKVPTKRRQLLFLGRIHPVKGIDILLRAWEAVESRFVDWDLRIVGPDERGYLEEMQALTARLRLKRVEFCGPLYGDEKWRAYRAASVYVLATHTENFGMTVAEALAAGTPAIVSRAAPWEGLLKHGAGWWIEGGVDSLVACLEEALLASPQRLEEMGRRGHYWMDRDFSWNRIGGQFLSTYEWMVHGGEKPVWVYLG